MHCHRMGDYPMVKNIGLSKQAPISRSDKLIYLCHKLHEHLAGDTTIYYELSFHGVTNSNLTASNYKIVYVLFKFTMGSIKLFHFVDARTQRDCSQGVRRVRPRDCPQGGRRVCPRNCPQGGRRVCPRDCPQGVRKVCPRDYPQGVRG